MIFFYLDFMDKKQNLFKNIIVSRHLQHFIPQIKHFAFLDFIYDPNKPIIMFGLYDKNDFITLLNHKSKSLIIFGGTDTYIQKYDFHLKKMQLLKKLIHKRNQTNKEIKLVSISKFISEDLKQLKLSFQTSVWYSFDKKKFKPTIKGPHIYIYLPKNRKNFYGYHIFKILNQMLDFRFIIGDGTTKHENIQNLYKKCFIGLRLVEHDGSATTVQELGLMGIKTIHNGSLPSSLNYESIDDIKNHILSESKKINTIDYHLSAIMDEYLNINKDIFNI